MNFIASVVSVLATLMGFPFEHKVASTVWIDRLPKPYDAAPVDDDYYYELVALRSAEPPSPLTTFPCPKSPW